jgi:hypothetical protein
VFWVSSKTQFIQRDLTLQACVIFVLVLGAPRPRDHQIKNLPMAAAILQVIAVSLSQPWR